MRTQRDLILGIALAAISLLKVSPATCAGAGQGVVAPSQAKLSPIEVLVTEIASVPGSVMYRYTVVNGSAFPITALLVGYDEYYGVPKLVSVPVGWNGDSLPPTSCQAPSGWTCAVEPTEEDSLTNLKWEIEGQAGGIVGGEIVGGFAVILAHTDPTYDKGGVWTVYVRGHSPLWGTLQASGSTPIPDSSILAHSDLKISPDPVKGAATIQFHVPVDGKVVVEIFDLMGRRVKRVVSEPKANGASSVLWDGKDDSGRSVGVGVYLIRVKTPTTLRFARIAWPSSSP